LEELAQFAICFVVLLSYDVPWWSYVLLFIGPDIGMIGYLMNSKVGSITYNFLHHKGIAIGCVLVSILYGHGAHPTEGLLQDGSLLLITGIILYGHASMDRIFGYGLKFNDSFHHTHLGWIGKAVKGVGQSD
ncbi:MAG: DUF4260 domain-containing protein, partial [Flavobacteriales bacterium]